MLFLPTLTIIHFNGVCPERQFCPEIELLLRVKQFAQQLCPARGRKYCTFLHDFSLENLSPGV